jgi:SAM-dependent methyltransferase
VSADSSWAERAASLYDHAYAKRYRAHDEEFPVSAPCREFAEWLGRVCAMFTPPIDVLDLGCGTGRYFWAVTGVKRLVGLDASAAMLEEARRPYNADRIGAPSVSLIQGDLLTHRFEAARFDLVYSVGVLAEHVPFDEALVARIVEWLKPGGRFAFTTVHPASPSIPRTRGRRIGEAIVPAMRGAARRGLRRRLLARGLYADEERVHELLDLRFAIESLERVESEAHLHCLCVARRVGA